MILRNIIIFYLINISGVLGQDYKGYGNNMAIINYLDSTVRIEISTKTQNFKPYLDRAYYWFASNTIINTVGGYDGKLLDGVYRCYYLNKNLKSRGLFKKGLKNGYWLTWYQNGMISSEIKWRRGILNGSYKTFDEKGQITKSAHYKRNLLNGQYQTFEDGNLDKKKEFKDGKEVEKIGKSKNSKKPNDEMEKEGNRSLIDKIKNIFKSKKKRSNE